MIQLCPSLDGSYLRSEVRIPDAKPTAIIAFNDSKKERVGSYLQAEASAYVEVLESAAMRIDGFESPLGLELLASVDWLLAREGRQPTLRDIKAGLSIWPGGQDSGARKLRIFEDRLLRLALSRLAPAV